MQTFSFPFLEATQNNTHLKTQSKQKRNRSFDYPDTKTLQSMTLINQTVKPGSVRGSITTFMITLVHNMCV